MTLELSLLMLFGECGHALKNSESRDWLIGQGNRDAVQSQHKRAAASRTDCENRVQCDTLTQRLCILHNC